jgi:PAP2 superfamily
MKHLFVIVFSFSFILFSACKPKADQAAIDQFCKNQLPEWNNKLTQVIISDIFTPPVCSRIYAYTNIAAYEALRPAYTNYPSYAGKLNGLQALPLPKQGTAYCYPIASIIAFTTVARALVFNGGAIKEMENELLKQLDSINMDRQLLDSSVSFGRQAGNHIISWATADGYLQRNSLPAYIVTKEPGRWQPTPPGYADAIETNWKTLRPLLLDSGSQFRPVPPTKYDTLKNTAFYKEAYSVYEEVKNPHQSDSAIAWYWDDNPNTSVTNGHITYFQQKNSPPGHWIHIACSVAEKENYGAMKTASLVSKIAIALHDAFISCWDAKYTFNYIRPETFINKYIDKDWVPLIQTPPFPEYPSGHSVVSSSAATVLTQIVGDKYAFVDSAEIPFGRPTRAFNSFYEAADQASISRFYGGIHFVTAIENGKQQGKRVGAFVMAKFK